jgi:hypothetical protein
MSGGTVMRTCSGIAATPDGRIVTTVQVTSLSDDVREQAELLMLSLTKVAQHDVGDVADAMVRAAPDGRAVAQRTESFLSGLLRRLLAPFEADDAVHALLKFAGCQGMLSRTLLHHREGKQTGNDVRYGALHLAESVQVVLQSVGVHGLAFVPGDVVQKVRDELVFARAKFPPNTLQMTALNEECGEFAHAVGDLLRGKVRREQGMAAVRKEAVQVMAMCVRVATEGDSTLPYDPETVGWPQ